MEKVTPYKIALDAHGSDQGVSVAIEGAIAAIEKFDCEVILVGSLNEIEKFLKDDTSNVGSKIWPKGLSHIEASEKIEMCEEPVKALRKKPNSSIGICGKIVEEGLADAMVGAGNTGAMMASALLTIGRIKGVERPGIAVELPAPGDGTGAKGRQILMDAGANVNTEPFWMFQHGLMAKAYVQHRWEIDEPDIGLLSNGEEPSKGDLLHKEAYKLLQNIEGFIGNCEGKDLTTSKPTIIISDGFTGNVALKTIEATYKSISKMFLEILSKPELAQASGQIMPELFSASKEMHPDSFGGAVLLGVNSPVVIAHGHASSVAVFNAIRVACECLSSGVVDAIKDEISKINSDLLLKG